MPSSRARAHTIIGVFAHPDDEAFGPAGTLAKLAQEHDVHLICVTDGDAGMGLAQVRKQELRESAKILGIKKLYFLDFKDGDLSNNLYHQVTQAIQEKLEAHKPEIIITFEPRGISGHIDHVAVSMTTSFLFQKLPFIKQLWYYCIDTRQRRMIADYFIYFPPGYRRSEINKTIDISGVWDKKVAAIKAHASQSKDGERILLRLSRLPKKEYFLEINR